MRENEILVKELIHTTRRVRPDSFIRLLFLSIKEKIFLNLVKLFKSIEKEGKLLNSFI